MSEYSLHEERTGLLEDSDSLQEEPLASTEKRSGQHSTKKRGWTATSSILACFLFICIVDFTALLWIADIVRNTWMDNSDLDWPNPYVGLAELYKVGGTNTSSIEPILNKARIATQVYREKPSLPGSRGEHDVDTPSGRLSPREKHLQVNDETNTILQFRTIDFGMEECSLVLRLPDDRLAEADGISYTMSDPLSLNICAMDVAKLLDVKQVTWRSRPQCSEHIATVNVIPGDDMELSRFPCAWGTFHTFEVSCAEPGCSVDVWSSASTAWGVYLYQYQTI